jgi:hypothetical protein
MKVLLVLSMECESFTEAMQLAMESGKDGWKLISAEPMVEPKVRKPRAGKPERTPKRGKGGFAGLGGPDPDEKPKRKGGRPNKWCPRCDEKVEARDTCRECQTKLCTKKHMTRPPVCEECRQDGKT